MVDSGAPENADDTTRDAREPPRMPRWVIASMLIVIVLALVFVITRLAGVQHGPGLHTPNADGARTASVAHTPPVDRGP